jgi:hypothetical protein
VVKRPDRDAKSLRDFANSEFVHLHLLRHVDQTDASRRVRVKFMKPGSSTVRDKS